MKARKFIPHSSPTISKKAIANVVEVMKSGHLGDGDVVTLFENKVKDYLGKQYALGTSNGFSAIHLTLIGMNVKEGDEVIMPSYSGPSLLNPILIQRAKPVILDTGKNSFNISPEEIRKNISSKTKAVIVPHIFGFSADIEEILSLGIPVIEDCAQSLGGRYKGKLLGSFAPTTIISFNNTKMMSTGDGGMLVTDDKQVYETAKNHRWYGYKKQHRYMAYNYRMNNIAAAIGLEQMDELEKFIEKRKEIAAIYDSYFCNELLIDIDFEHHEESAFYRYPISIANRDKVKKALADAGIGCGYGVLEGMHELTDADESKFPNTIHCLNTILSIPIYPKLSLGDAKYVAKKVVETVKKYAE